MLNAHPRLAVPYESHLYNTFHPLLKYYGGLDRVKKITQPRLMPSWGLYCPGRGLFKNRPDYCREAGFNARQPTIAILMHGGMHFSDAVPIVDMLYEHLSGTVNLLPIFSRVENNMEALQACCEGIDLLINMQYFRLWGGPYGGDPEVIYRFLRDRTIKQPLAKAVGVKRGYRPTVLDGTAGFGEDGFVLASLGCTVTMVERSPIVWALLADAIDRARADDTVAQVFNSHVTLLQADAIDYLASATQVYDTIYLDPMYPSAPGAALNPQRMRTTCSSTSEA